MARFHRIAKYIAWVVVGVLLGLIVDAVTGSFLAGYLMIVLVGLAASFGLRRGWL